MNRALKFFQLPLRRKLLVLRCWRDLNIVAMALRMISLPRLLRLMGTNQGRIGPDSRHSKTEVIWSIRAAAALSWKPSCAVRGLVAERIFRQNGYAVQFKCGVSRLDDFQAHAWVEDEAGVLVGESEATYHSLPDLSSTA